VWAVEQPSGGATTLVRFSDFRRLDLVFHRLSELPQIATWGASLLWPGHQVLFSHTPDIDAALNQPFLRPTPPTYDAVGFDRMVNAYWFAAGVAVYKVVRADLLIGLHLALELEQQCLLLGMMLRDRDVGTTHHRDGNGGGPYVERLRGAQQEYTAAGILRIIEACAIEFDALAAQYGASYVEHRHPLLRNIAEARSTLSA
ncbi:MAG: hypothetical protein M3506_06290, partial [Chloroflexota bacterium]|nr:hypothetical protein [Chloroflexota bacterium]